jgi:hypothetical protein
MDTFKASIGPLEQRAVDATLAAGAAYGYGNMIAHLKTAWAERLMRYEGFTLTQALQAADTSAYPVDESLAPPTDPWKPQVGKPCLNMLGGTATVTPVFYVEKYDKWVVDTGKGCDVLGVEFLRPLPPAPPVQMGDIVLIEQWGGIWRVGKVVYASDRDFQVLSWHNGLECTILLDGRTTITKLVPADKEAKP